MKLSAYAPLGILFQVVWWVELARADVRHALKAEGYWRLWFLQRSRHAASTARCLLAMWRRSTFATGTR